MYVFVRGVMEVVFYVFIVRRGSVGGKCECFVMQMQYVCVHPVAVLNAALYMTCSLLMLIKD